MNTYVKTDPNKEYSPKYARRVAKCNGNPWRIASLRVSKQKCESKRRGLEWGLIDDKVIEKIAKSKTCALSGRPFKFEINNIDQPSIDRKNSNIGYTSRNIQIVTSTINRAKSTLTDKQFIEMCCCVAEHHGWIKPNKL
jgi:hypothetical protein